MLPEGWQVPEACELGDADVPLPEVDELGGRAGQAVDADELGSAEALHVDAVAEKGVPVQVVVRVRDEDARPVQDYPGVAGPDEVELRATCRNARRDHRGSRHGRHWAMARHRPRP